MATAPAILFRALSLFAALFVFHLTPAQAQNDKETRALYGQLFEIMSKTTAANARDQVSKCEAMRQQMKGVPTLSDPQRLDFESLVERCIVVAMNRGEFSDKTGDQCAHQYARAEKLAAAIDGWLKEPTHGGQDLASRGRELDTIGDNGKLLGCKSDYGAFAKTVAATHARK